MTTIDDLVVQAQEDPDLAVLIGEGPVAVAAAVATSLGEGDTVALATTTDGANLGNGFFHFWRTSEEMDCASNDTFQVVGNSAFPNDLYHESRLLVIFKALDLLRPEE